MKMKGTGRPNCNQFYLPEGLTVMASMNCSFHEEEPTTSDALARCTNLSTVFCNITLLLLLLKDNNKLNNATTTTTTTSRVVAGAGHSAKEKEKEKLLFNLLLLLLLLLLHWMIHPLLLSEIRESFWPRGKDKRQGQGEERSSNWGTFRPSSVR